MKALLWQACVSGVLMGGVYALVALGLTLIFGVLRIINFAHGTLMMLGMYATFFLYSLAGIDPYLSVLLVGPAFFVVGMALERAVIEPNIAAPESNQLLLTLGLALFLENAALALFSPDYRSLQLPYASRALRLGDAVVNLPRLIAFAGAVALAVGLWLFLKHTDTGKAIRAAAEEREGALLMGIDIRRLYAIAFGLGSGVVAIAGSLVTPFLYVAPDVGDVFNILAFVIVVLGGMGSFVGALVGGVLVGLAESVGAALLPGSLKQLPIFVLFVLVLFFRPTGLVGRRL
ncbi:MAG TPA: branched-chain amino acid ABC transporter permease [Methylomirabilota bacterium]|jgi:branched-chain amino acid transport system permease protein|nr:branched-chain amino acid ABC transporter permease [Methylomirabilota bacterium]